jgi:hypothetical protein
VSWQVETGAVVPSADPTLTGIVLSPKRISAQTLISRQLIVQATGSEPFDQFLASRLKLACSSVLDQAALYGATNGPTGIIGTTGTNLVTTASPIVWVDFVALRLAATDHDVDRSNFGFIVSPHGRNTCESTARFANAGITIWDAVKGESEVPKQITDGRVFCGCWSYMAICTWGAGAEGEFAVDLVIDPYTQAVNGKVAITISMFCDVGIRWSGGLCLYCRGRVVTKHFHVKNLWTSAFC